jgi:hypothetical protein
MPELRVLLLAGPPGAAAVLLLPPALVLKPFCDSV